jgi:hypothetical protein
MRHSSIPGLYLSAADALFNTTPAGPLYNSAKKLPVAISAQTSYISAMPRSVQLRNNTSPRQNPARAAPAELMEALERSKAQAEAGQRVPLEPALNRLRSSIARMKAKSAGE